MTKTKKKETPHKTWCTWCSQPWARRCFYESINCCWEARISLSGDLSSPPFVVRVAKQQVCWMSEAQIVRVAWAGCSAQCVIIMMCWWEANNCVCARVCQCSCMCVRLFTRGLWVISSYAHWEEMCVRAPRADAFSCKSVWIAEE